MPLADPFIQRFSIKKAEFIGPLSGARVAVKDLFHIKGRATTAGHPAWPGAVEPQTDTASCVTQLFDAGAEICGKTITDELAYSLDGINIHYGTPIHPDRPDRLPGGSSSGSATAVATEQADVGLGTDTGGSIRVPASYQGLFGLRPTHGRIATDNMVSLAPGFDTVGWMCRDLDMLNKVAHILMSADTADINNHDNVGVFASWFASSDMANTYQPWLAANTQDWTDVSPLCADDLGSRAADCFRVLQGRQIWRNHGAWIETTRPAFSHDVQQRLDVCRNLTEDDEQIAEQARKNIQGVVAQLFEQVDWLMLPTTPGVAPQIARSAEHIRQHRHQLLMLTSLAGLCGLPQLHLPLFSHNELPFGLSLIGRAGSDLALIARANTIIQGHHETD